MYDLVIIVISKCNCLKIQDQDFKVVWSGLRPLDVTNLWTNLTNYSIQFKDKIYCRWYIYSSVRVTENSKPRKFIIILFDSF